MSNWRTCVTLIAICLAVLTPSDTSAKGSRVGKRATHSTSARTPRPPRVRSYTRPSSRTYTPRRVASPRTSSSHVRRAPLRPSTTTPRLRSTTPRLRAASPRAASASRTPRTYQPRTSSAAAVGVARDGRGRITRSQSAKRAFERRTGFQNGRSGYVVDHIKPLACGGADAPSNMQWQSVTAAKAKDKVERKGC
jgi:hypothetical protein